MSEDDLGDLRFDEIRVRDSDAVMENEAVETRKWVMLFILLWSTCYGVSANAVNALVSFLHYFLKFLAKFAPVLVALSSIFPKSLHMLHKHVGLNKDDFTKYVVCKSCHSIYLYEDCFEKLSNGQSVPITCTYYAFPQHPNMSQRKACGHRLLKEIVLKNGAAKYYPLHVYCYNGVIKSLLNILGSDHKVQLCEKWRNRCVPPNTLADIYDGKIWKEMKWKDGSRFFDKEHNLGLMLNCDWFPPFERTEYSVGVLYAVILNLPRAIRFKPENVIIISIIPGPSEPPLTINTYLKPLVDELLDLWEDGVSIRGMKFNVALVCIACDRPAAHKIGGFLGAGHSSNHACCYCTKNFPYDKTIKKMDYSGFNSFAPLRNHIDHKNHGSEWIRAKSKSERDTIEKIYGSRFTQLNLLPYFDSINQIALDPMHNLFEGTAKRVMKKIWLNDENPLIRKKDFEKVHDTISAFKTPSSIGRLPLKVLSGYSSFTADQWKNWTLWFSLISIHDIIPTSDYDCWKIFVSACTILSSPVVTYEEVADAHQLLLKFCITIEELYGCQSITPNMHYHIHLAQSILNFGPIQTFWLFSFERYNGILGNYHTNQRSVEIQMMQKFCDDMYIASVAATDDAIGHHKDLFSSLLHKKISGSLKDNLEIDDTSIISMDSSIESLLKLPHLNVEKSLLYLHSSFIHFMAPFSRCAFNNDELRYVRLSYATFLPDIDILEVPVMYEKCHTIKLFGDRYGSVKMRSEKNCYIQAFWVKEFTSGDIDLTSSKTGLGIIQFFFRQRIHCGGIYRVVPMAKVSWFQNHPDINYFGQPVEVWCNDMYHSLGPASFIPVNRIKNQVVACVTQVKEETVLTVCPIKRKIYI